MKLDLDQIKKLALEATPGPWKYDCGNQQIERDHIQRNPICDISHSELKQEPDPDWYDEDMKMKFQRMVYWHADGDYIAAVSPDVVIYLIDTIKKYEEAFDLISKELNHD